jgi:hypothetical protein
LPPALTTRPRPSVPTQSGARQRELAKVLSALRSSRRDGIMRPISPSEGAR